MLRRDLRFNNALQHVWALHFPQGTALGKRARRVGLKETYSGRQPCRSRTGCSVDRWHRQMLTTCEVKKRRNGGWSILSGDCEELCQSGRSTREVDATLVLRPPVYL